MTLLTNVFLIVATTVLSVIVGAISLAGVKLKNIAVKNYLLK
jgi:hypothetical protein